MLTKGEVQSEKDGDLLKESKADKYDAEDGRGGCVITLLQLQFPSVPLSQGATHATETRAIALLHTTCMFYPSE